ncbi:MAG: slipin family protein [Chloroflexi bacterium]|nr:slipin family protein [Chloroflexota bacterium]
MQWLILAAIAAVFALIVWLRRRLTRITIFEYQRGILYTDGIFRRVLTPGAYWCFMPRTTITRLDLRPRFASINGQEVLSADNVGLRLSLAAKYQIIDPLKAAHNSDNYETALYLELQIALRDLVGAVKIDELLDKRQELSAQLFERSASAIQALGLELLSVSIKDVMFPGELKRIFAQVVKAQKEGLAALERARGESAALRNLANAAKMLEQNPALMQLRLLQTVGDGSGNTVVLGMNSQVVPLPIKPGGAASSGAPSESPDQ